MMEQKEHTHSPKKVLFTGFGVFLLFVLAFVIFFFLSFETVEVKGQSMEPTFHTGQRLLITRLYWLVGPIKKNDVVVVHHPGTGEVIIKRVYAVAGDVVDFYNVPESWNLGKGEYKVPADSYYILGDNRPVSDDSRLFGPIKSSAILGKVVKAEFLPHK